jgi:hypothetical protein
LEELAAGHIWLGSGGAKRQGVGGGKHGVGLLLHQRLAHSVISSKAMSARLLFVDLSLQGHKLRIICIYMPHTGYADHYVEEMYYSMDAVIHEARARGHNILIAGDWNAEVGGGLPGDCEYCIGRHGQGVRNLRGSMLVSWCFGQSLCIANTFFRKQWRSYWTHCHDGRERAIDYFLVDSSLRKWLVNVESCDALDLGSDQLEHGLAPDK